MALPVNQGRNFEAELQYWEQWCRTILVFLGDTPRIPRPTQQLASSVAIAAQDGNLEELCGIAGRLGAMAEDLRFEARERLDAVLESRFGRNLKHLSGQAEVAVQRALKKGRIDTDGEFRLVRSYLVAAATDPTRLPHAARVDPLVTSYEPEQRRQANVNGASPTPTPVSRSVRVFPRS